MDGSITKQYVCPEGGGDIYIYIILFHTLKVYNTIWALRKLGVDEWFIRTVMALYTEASTVVKTDAGLSESFNVKLTYIKGQY